MPVSIRLPARRCLRRLWPRVIAADAVNLELEAKSSVSGRWCQKLPIRASWSKRWNDSSFIVERIKDGMRRAKWGQRLGRAPLDVDRVAIVRERVSGMSLTQVAKRHRVSRATVVRLVREANQREIIVAA